MFGSSTIKCLFTLAKIQSARKASHHLTFMENCQAVYLNVPKCPGGYPILNGGLKLKTKISAWKYKKIKFTVAS